MIAKLLASMYGKLIGLALILLVFLGVFVWGHYVGADGVQAKWDLANASQTTLAVQASESARATEQGQAQAFAGIADDYLRTTHDYPSIADALPAAVAAGTVRLRNACPAASGSDVSGTATRARGVDVAAAAAATQRLADSIAAVSAGDAADAREQQLRAQVTALQAILRAERETKRINP